MHGQQNSCRGPLKAIPRITSTWWYADMKRGRTDTVPFDYEVVQDSSDGESLLGATKRNALHTISADGCRRHPWP